jgi:hypothetical protein
MRSADIKNFYETYGDEIVAKRLESPYPLRSYAHRTQYETIANLVESGETVLDAVAAKACFLVFGRAGPVTAMDISRRI